MRGCWESSGRPGKPRLTAPLAILGPNLVLVVKGQHTAVQDEEGDTMKRSDYLIWLRRLVVLGAVVGGLAAPAVGAAPNVPDYGPYPISGGTGFNQYIPDQANSTGVSGCAIGPRSTCALVG